MGRWGEVEGGTPDGETFSLINRFYVSERVYGKIEQKVQSSLILLQALSFSCYSHLVISVRPLLEKMNQNY